MRASLLLTTAAMICGQAPAQPANPFFTEWKTPFGVPPFGLFKEAHFLPAIQEGILRQRAEVEAIVKNPATPSFENTLVALDGSGRFLERVNNVFFSLCQSDSTDGLQAIAQEAGPLLAALGDDISLNEGLFARVKAVFEQRGQLKLKADQLRLLEKTYKSFVRGGANLAPAQKERLRAINAELSVVTLKTDENLLKETNAYRLVIDKPVDLAGLPAAVVSAAAEAAKAAGLEGKWVFTLHAPSIWPFLQYAENRELRKQILTAYTRRCDQNNDSDNKVLIARIATLRAEKARLLGYKTWADFGLENTMAKTPAAVYGFMEQLWKPALATAKREAAEMQALIDAEKGGFKLEPWDWHFYAEKVKKAKFDLDEEALRPYFALDKVRNGAFEVANRLYGITFTERKDLPVYHPEVKAFEVKEKNGRHLAIFYVDYHPRPSKSGGAWSGGFRSRRFRDGQRVEPVIMNVGNFAKPVGDKPALLNLEEATTLYHELGHALDSMFDMSRYSFSSSTDYSELPSQILEHWLTEPEVLKRHARHYQTGAPIPDALIAKIQKSATFNQGFATTEFLASAILDMDWHTLPEGPQVDATAFEKATLARIGLIPEIFPRYRSPYYSHVWNGGYDAGYYGYYWSGVLDTDAFQAFKEKGNIFDPATAKAFRKNILAMGGCEDPAILYRRFRGRDPKVEALIERRGLK